MTDFPAIIAVICLCGIGGISSQTTCDDVDTTVCQKFQDNRDICVDPCLSKLCPRTCGTCPLKCYKCDSVSNVQDCNTTLECPANNMCIVTESLGADFSMTYRLGCATNDVCSQLFGSAPTGSSLIVGKRAPAKRANLNGDCCNTDLCNRHFPTPPRVMPNVTTTMEMMTTTVMMTSTTEASNLKCMDIDTSACQRLFSLNKAMCSDPCVVQACPRTCGQCSECYWCDHVKNPEQCNTTTQCEREETCYVLETLSYSGEHSYNVGCMHQKVCSQFHTQASHVFGKRADPVELSLDGDCCSGDLCNHHALTHVTATTTAAPTDMCAYTAANHHCPTNFHLVDGKCYMIGSTALNYDDAMNFCKTHCSKLAENLSRGDYIALEHFVSGRSHLFIGARDPRKNGEFVWNTSGRHAGTLNYFGAILGVHNPKPCASFSPVRPGLHAEDCTDSLRPLCQASMK
ncbi:uncharacterized protein LOC134229252 [Saccostrea cucullata]|uniref:uncharacterized protein LOC134229252 n=1 Tax=Saccostrea cuccullata TaxID=36930 RepID=UPI002ED65578